MGSKVRGVRSIVSKKDIQFGFRRKQQNFALKRPEKKKEKATKILAGGMLPFYKFEAEGN